MQMNGMTIGQVAKAAGLGIETIRYYERERLLERPARRSSGYRQFDEVAVKRLRFIKQAQRLGFTLREIRELLALRLNPSSTRNQIRERAQAKVADIELRIAELQRMKSALLPLIEACDGQGDISGCPILEAMDQPALELTQVNKPKRSRKE
jgi:MerR family transcriptional regulator, copper efflux regulator